VGIETGFPLGRHEVPRPERGGHPRNITFELGVHRDGDHFQCCLLIYLDTELCQTHTIIRRGDGLVPRVGNEGQ